MNRTIKLSHAIYRSTLALALISAACTDQPAADDEAGDTSSSEEESEGTESGGSESTESESTDTADTTEPAFCDIIAQDCPQGEKCVAYSSSGGNEWTDTKCVPVMGDQAPGEPCTWDGITEGTDDCDATSMCWEGTCMPYCSGTDSDATCPAGYFCHVPAASTLTFCHESCDPLQQECDEGDSCYWTGQGFGCVVQLDDVAAGQPCGLINECAQGLICVNSEWVPDCAGASCCAPFCDVTQPDCADLPGTECVAFFEPGQAPAGYEDVGVCGVPN